VPVYAFIERIIRGKTLKSFSFLVFLCLFGFSAYSQVVATVGDKTITVKDFNERYDQIKKQTLNPPPKELFLEDLIRFELGVQEAEKRNLRENPIVKDRINQELYKALVEFELAKKIDEIKITEAEMKSYYEKNPELRTSHILIEVKQDATKEQRESAKKRAEDILAEVKKSKRPFEELVNMYTDDLATKKSGGDIGWQTRLTVAKEFYDAALGMKPGQIKGLVETSFGYHIIKLTGRNSYDQANKRQVRASVFDEKRNRLFDEFFAGLKKKYQIKSNPSLLK
jgi:parvulin-like peptidyl-prolyl isomerase